jgi:hypothetical protein
VGKEIYPMSYMSVQCSILEGSCKNLSESPVKALNGNAFKPTPAFLIVDRAANYPTVYGDLSLTGYDFPYMPNHTTSPSPSRPYTSGARFIYDYSNTEGIYKPTYLRSFSSSQWDATYLTGITFTDATWTNFGAINVLGTYSDYPPYLTYPMKSKMRICGPVFGIVAYYQHGYEIPAGSSANYTSTEYVELNGSYYNNESNSYYDVTPETPTDISPLSGTSGVVFWIGLTSASQIPANVSPNYIF